MGLNASIKTAASALVNDFIASGSFSASQVSACDYGVLDNPGACAIVIQPLTSPLARDAYGQISVSWGLRVEAYIKDTQNPVAVLTRLWDVHDAIAEVVLDGTHLNCASLNRDAVPTSFNRPADTYIEFGGHDYLPVFVTVQVTEQG